MSGVEDRPRLLIIKTQQEGENVRLTVQDAGVGLATEDAERPFESFYTTKQDGMGILDQPFHHRAHWGGSGYARMPAQVRSSRSLFLANTPANLTGMSRLGMF